MATFYPGQETARPLTMARTATAGGRAFAAWSLSGSKMQKLIMIQLPALSWRHTRIIRQRQRVSPGLMRAPRRPSLIGCSPLRRSIRSALGTWRCTAQARKQVSNDPSYQRGEKVSDHIHSVQVTLGRWSRCCPSSRLPLPHLAQMHSGCSWALQRPMLDTGSQSRV